MKIILCEFITMRNNIDNARVYCKRKAVINAILNIASCISSMSLIEKGLGCVVRRNQIMPWDIRLFQG